MNIEIIRGILIPFLGTVLGSACVFFLRKNIGDLVQRALTGFAAGVMVAASIWSLLIPAMEQSAAMGKWSFVPAVAGFWVGILFLLLLDHVIPHLHMKSEEAEGPKKSWQKSTMLLLAVTLHNIRDGGRRCICRLYGRQQYDHRSRCTGSCHRYCNPELPRGCNHFHATARSGHE